MWVFTPRNPSADQLAASVGLSPIVAQILLMRGYNNTLAAQKFLGLCQPDWHDPALLPGILTASKIIDAAIMAQDLICIYGDYDVDGLTSTSILARVLTRLGARAIHFVPHRYYDGYGPNVRVIQRLAKLGVRVLVTADCGIAAVDELAVARQLGMQVIITDHHEPKSTYPVVSATVHPRLHAGNYPWGGLCGAGVALKLASFLLQRKQQQLTPDEYLLATFGTIADVVPLLDENRWIVRQGLRLAQYTTSPGLASIISVAGLDPRTITSTGIAFQIAPRLNAAGRLSCASLALEMLTTTNPARAHYIAESLTKYNDLRKKIEKRIYQEALSQCKGHDPVHIVAGSGWHAGVVGIVASKLVEATGKPVLIGQRTPSGGVHGSGRSVAGLPLHEALRGTGPLLEAGGGHAAAVGWKVTARDFDAFSEKIKEEVARLLPGGMGGPLLTIDAEIPLMSLTTEFIEQLAKLAPFGAGNPEPVVAVLGVTVGNIRTIGADKTHLSFEVYDENTTRRAVFFSGAARLPELQETAELIDIAFRPSLNEWQGRRTAEMQVVDFRPSV